MKILFDHLAFNQVYGGVSRYFVELIKRLKAYDVDITLTVKFSNNHFIKSLKPGVKPFLASTSFRGKPRIERALGNLFTVAKTVFSGKPDIYHATHYSNYLKPFISSKTKVVTTIHDMNYWAVPEYYAATNYNKIRQEAQMKSCDQIIAVSDQTRKDIVQFFPELESKIAVIHHGIHDIEDVDLGDSLKLPKDYIFFVGARNPYKNFPKFLEAFTRLHKDNPSLHLVCAGKKFSPAEKALFEELAISNNISQISANDSELRYLYRKARLFVFPSIYEGFGLPCVEAMSAECPMALSDNSVFPEVCGEAANYFDPNSIDSMYEVIHKSLYDEQSRELLQKEMAERIKLFSWDISARKHYEVYQKLMAND